MKGRFRTLVKILISASLASIIIYRIGFQRFHASLREADYRFVVAALLLAPLVSVIGGLKWRLMVRSAIVTASFGEAMVSFLGGASMGLLTPARVGEFTRILFFPGGDRAALLGIAIVDKGVDLVVTLGFAAFGATVFFGPLAGLGVALVVGMGLVCLMASSLFRVLTPLVPSATLRSRVGTAVDAAAGIPRRSLAVAMVWRAIASGVDMFQFVLLLRAFGILDVFAAVAVYPAILLVNVLPITIGGLGLREGLSAVALSRFQVPPEAAVNASFGLFCANTLLPGMVGAPFVSRIRLRQERTAGESDARS